MTSNVALAVPVCTGVRVAGLRMVVMVGRHHGGVAMRVGPLGHRHINRRSGGMRVSHGGVVVGAFFREGLKLREGDDGWRSWWAPSPSSWSLSLCSRVKQGSFGLVSSILKCLRSCGVNFKCSLG